MSRWMSLLMILALGLAGCGEDEEGTPVGPGDTPSEGVPPEVHLEGVVEEVFEVPLPDGAVVAFEMIRIAPGSFIMGTPEDEPEREDNESPLHPVTISTGFWLGKYEITQAQWEAVMDTIPWSGRAYVQAHPNCPAMYLSWNDAQEFIRRVNAAADTDAYRLPTEAEWEHACRAGTTTQFSYGQDETQLGWYGWYQSNAWNMGEQYPHWVGQKLPNPLGLYDMHGNVWEWVQDWFRETYYLESPEVDPQGPETGSLRVRKGGDFHYLPRGLRSGRRGRSTPDFRQCTIGFRLLRQEP